MATGDQERDQRVGQFPMLEFVDGHMRRQVIHPVYVHAQARGETFRGRDSNE